MGVRLLRLKAFSAHLASTVRRHPTASHNTAMPPSQPAFRWRTILELTTISAVVYFFLGAPGLSGVLKSSGRHVATPKALVRPESLVYPNTDLQCKEHGYDIHVYSTKPLVIYIDGFLGGQEAEQLVELR